MLSLLGINRISTLELTVCHESNLLKSKAYKESKYAMLHNDCLPKYQRYPLERFTIEVSTLGFISDFKDFCQNNLHDNALPLTVRNEIISSVINHSYSIYCNRNNAS